jgi:plasmid stability protein
MVHYFIDNRKFLIVKWRNNGGNMATLNIKKFPDDLYKLLQQRAEIDRRSLAQEIICLLQSALHEAEKPSILNLRGLGKKRWKGINATRHVDSERESWE